MKHGDYGLIQIHDKDLVTTIFFVDKGKYKNVLTFNYILTSAKGGWETYICDKWIRGRVSKFRKSVIRYISFSENVVGSEMNALHLPRMNISNDMLNLPTDVYFPFFSPINYFCSFGFDFVLVRFCDFNSLSFIFR